MPHLLYRIQTLIGKIYFTAEKAVIGSALQVTNNSREQCDLRLTFDYLFFHLLFLLPKLTIALYFQNTTDLLILAAYMILLPMGMLLLKKSPSPKKVSIFVTLTTLVLPMVSSFYNNLDISPRYTLMWMLSLLFCFIINNRCTTYMMGFLLCGYLGLVAYMKMHHLSVAVTAGYVPEQQSPFMPLMTGLYILFMIRVFGKHYQNIFKLEHELTLQKQKQHSSLLNQHLTKQFIILKGLSRSGKSKYLDGNKELLEACLLEIEKQCESAIEYLDSGHIPES